MNLRTKVIIIGLLAALAVEESHPKMPWEGHTHEEHSPLANDELRSGVSDGSGLTDTNDAELESLSL